MFDRLHLSLVLLWLLAAVAGAADLKSGVFEPPRAAPGFALHGSHGQLFNLEESRGKVVVLGFGFSHCPEICPTTLANLSRVMKNLGENAKDVQVLYITVDPERDTVARLREYMAVFNPEFIGLTGSAEDLAAIRQAYGILIEREAHGDGNYEVHHSSYLYLIDREGRLRALVPYGKTVADITHDLEILLREPRAAAP